MFAVMKLIDEMTVNFYGTEVVAKIKDVKGLIPVYETEEEAKKEAGEKYEIVEIRAKVKTVGKEN